MLDLGTLLRGLPTSVLLAGRARRPPRPRGVGFSLGVGPNARDGASQHGHLGLASNPGSRFPSSTSRQDGMPAAVACRELLKAERRTLRHGYHFLPCRLCKAKSSAAARAAELSREAFPRRKTALSPPSALLRVQGGRAPGRCQERSRFFVSANLLLCFPRAGLIVIKTPAAAGEGACRRRGAELKSRGWLVFSPLLRCPRLPFLAFSAFQIHACPLLLPRFVSSLCDSEQGLKPASLSRR